MFEMSRCISLGGDMSTNEIFWRSETSSADSEASAATQYQQKVMPPQQQQHRPVVSPTGPAPRRLLVPQQRAFRRTQAQEAQGRR